MALSRIFRLFVPPLAIVLLGGFDNLPRTLNGIVTDQSARPVSQAAVQLENERTLAVRSYITDAHGEFHFAELSPDIDYDVRAEFDGMRSAKKTFSQFDSRRNAMIKLVIRLPH